MQNATRRWRFVVRSWWVMQGLNLRPLPCEGCACGRRAASVPTPYNSGLTLRTDFPPIRYEMSALRA
jgi:hypothetical protein